MRLGSRHCFTLSRWAPRLQCRRSSIVFVTMGCVTLQFITLLQGANFDAVASNGSTAFSLARASKFAVRSSPQSPKCHAAALSSRLFLNVPVQRENARTPSMTSAVKQVCECHFSPLLTLQDC